MNKVFNKNNTDDKTTIDLLPWQQINDKGIIATYDEKGQFQGLQRFLEVFTTDLYSLDDNDLVGFLDSFAALNRIVTDDMKIVSLPSRVNTSSSQVYWRKIKMKNRANTAQDAIRIQIQEENLRNLINIERSPDVFRELKFYIIIYADTEKQMEQLTRTVASASGKLKARPISVEETQAALHRFNNMNSI